MPTRRTPPDEPQEEPTFEAGPPEGDEEDEAAALQDFASLAARLGRASQESREEADLADAFFARVNRLTKDAQKRLFSRPEFRELFDLAADKDVAPSPEDPPGTIYYRVVAGERVPWSKKPWTWADAWKFPTKTWVPERTEPLGFQGLMVTVFARRETTLPEMFYAQYLDRMRNEQLAEEHRDWLFMAGSGRLTDPGMVTAGGAQSRGINNHPRQPGYGNLCMPGAGVPELAHVGDLDAPGRRG